MIIGLLEIILIFITSILVTWIFLKLTPSVGLVHQFNHRSSHEKLTPHGGGAGFVLVGSTAGFWLLQGESLLLVILGLALFLAIVGFIDDIRPVAAKARFGAQVFSVCALLWHLDQLPALGPFQGLVLLGLLMFAGLWWINLFNFMDGIDSIASMQAISMLSAAAGMTAYFNLGIEDTYIFALMVIVVSTTTGFLILNWPPAKIFMGDVGSLWLGFIIFALALLTIQNEWLNYQAWLILGAVFISDATVTLLTRILRGERWYEAHRSHAYQKLSRQLIEHYLGTHDATVSRTKSHRAVSLGVLTINLLWLTPLAVTTLISPTWSWWVVLVAYLPILAFVVRCGAGQTGRF
jgi:Fuc2NAc and GlcNAc transferase